MESLEELEKKVFQLSKKDRAILIRDLIFSLDNIEIKEDYTDLWIEEAEGRYQEIETGKVKCISAEKIFKDLKSRFK